MATFENYDLASVTCSGRGQKALLEKLRNVVKVRRIQGIVCFGGTIGGCW